MKIILKNRYIFFILCSIIFCTDVLIAMEGPGYRRKPNKKILTATYKMPDIHYSAVYNPNNALLTLTYNIPGSCGPRSQNFTLDDLNIENKEYHAIDIAQINDMCIQKKSTYGSYTFYPSVIAVFLRQKNNIADAPIIAFIPN